MIRDAGRFCARLSSIKERPLLWAWKGVVPRRYLTTLVGNPGLGKSVVTCDLAARFTRGLPMPCGGENGFATPVDVLFLTTEDSADDTLQARLRVAGADLDRVRVIRLTVDAASQTHVDGKMSFPSEAALLETYIRETGIRVIVLDPIMEFIDSHINTWKDADVRKVLGSLQALAVRYDLAVIVVMHLNKSEDKNPLNQVAGSKSFVNMPRANWWVVADPANRTARQVVSLKTNITSEGVSFGYAIVDWPGSTDTDRWPIVAWNDQPSSLTKEDVMASTPGYEAPDSSPVDPEQALAELLRRNEGVVDYVEVQAMAEEYGLTTRTLRRAAEKLGVVKEKTSTMPARTTWRLPDAEGVDPAVSSADRETYR